MKIAKHVCLGTVPAGRVICFIKFDEGRLSITGVEGPKANGDCRGSCGQIVMSRDYYESEGWMIDGVKKFFDVWERWHLNDMTAGDPEQEACLREYGKGLNYEAACKVLDSHGLLVHNGYKYGTKWLREEVPQEVLNYLESLPEYPEENVPRCWRR